MIWFICCCHFNLIPEYVLLFPFNKSVSKHVHTKFKTSCNMLLNFAECKTRNNYMSGFQKYYTLKRLILKHAWEK